MPKRVLRMNPPVALLVAKPGNKVVEIAEAAEEISVPVITTASNSQQYVRLVVRRLQYRLNLPLANLCIAEIVSSSAGKLRVAY